MWRFLSILLLSGDILRLLSSCFADFNLLKLFIITSASSVVSSVFLSGRACGSMLSFSSFLPSPVQLLTSDASFSMLFRKLLIIFRSSFMRSADSVALLSAALWTMEFFLSRRSSFWINSSFKNDLLQWFRDYRPTIDFWLQSALRLSCNHSPTRSTLLIVF